MTDSHTAPAASELHQRKSLFTFSGSRSIGTNQSRRFRRRVLAMLRLAHRVLGLRRDRLGVGIPSTGRVIGLSHADVASGGPAGAKFPTCPHCRRPLALFMRNRVALGLALAAFGLLAPMGTASATTYGPSTCNSTTGTGPDGVARPAPGAPTDGSGVWSNVIGCGAAGASWNGVQVMGAYAAATGAGATALGYAATGAERATGVGMQAQASGSGSTAVGQWTRATGNGSVAIGGDMSSNSAAAGAQALGANAIAIGGQSRANRNGDIAIGSGAVANAQADALSALAVGLTANATGNDAAAFGNNARATNNYATAIGNYSSAAGQNSVATGNSASAGGDYSTAMGNFSSAAGRNSAAVGNGASAGGDASSAFGNFANAGAINSVAIGAGGAPGSYAGANASAAGAVAIGGNSTGAASAAAADALSFGGQSSVANGATSGIAVGRGASVSTEAVFGIAAGDGAAAQQANDIAIGKSASTNAGSAGNNIAVGNGVATGANGQNVAMGSGATTANSRTTSGGAVAIGRDQKATGDGAVALGDPNTANGDGAVALGRNNMAAGDTAGNTAANGAVAIGNENSAIGQGSVAMGANSSAAAAGAVAFGDTAKAQASKAVALGSGSTAANAGDVALGSGSKTAAAAGTANATINGQQYGFAGTAPASTVSVGDAGAERTVTNVAAGRLGASSTDAVNGSQLFASNQAIDALGTTVNDLGSNVDNLGNSTASAIGGGVSYDPATGMVSAPSFHIAGGTQTSVGDAIDALNQGWTLTTSGNATGTSNTAIQPGSTVTIKGDRNIAVTQNGGEIAIATSATPTFDSVTIANGGPVIGASGIDMNGQKIANVAAGTAGGDAVNYDQLQDAIGTSTKYFHANSSLADSTATGTDSVAVGPAAVAQNANDVAMGNGASTAGGQSGDVALGSGSKTAAAVGTANATINGQQYGFAGTAPASTVSVGDAGAERTVTNVAAGRLGASSTDAVNGSQLFASNQAIDALGTNVNNLGNSVATAFGGASSYDPATGKVTGGFNYEGSSYNSVQNVFDEIQNAVGDSRKYFHANSTDPDSVATGANALAIGPNTTTSGDDGIGIGNGANVGQSAAGGMAIGSHATVSTPGGIALGASSVASTGAGITGYMPPGATASGLDATQSTLAALSVGDAENGKYRQIIGVAAGTNDGDAVNVAQLKGLNGKMDGVGADVAAIFGGNSTYDPATGKLTGGFSYAGNSYNSVQNVFDQIQSAVDDSRKYFHANSTLPDSVANGTDSIAVGPNALAQNAGDVAVGNGASTLKGQAGDVAIGSGSQTAAVAATSGMTIGGATYTFAGVSPQSTFSIGAVGAERTLTNMAAGRVTADSTDGVNGSQLFAATQATEKVDKKVDASGASVAKLFGGSTVYDPATGQLTGGFKYAGGSYSSVQSVFDDIGGAVNGGGIKYFHANSSLADSDATGVNSVAVGPAASASGSNAVAIGNGAKATGGNSVALGSDSVAGEAVSTASTTINGKEYKFAGATPTGTVSVGDVGKERTITNVAAGRVDENSTDAVNGSQLWGTNKAVEDLANKVGDVGEVAKNAVVYDTDSNGNRQNSISLAGGDPNAPVVIHNVAAGTANTDAVNVGQLNNGLANTLTQSKAYTDQVAVGTLNQANSYTDSKFAGLQSDISSVRNEARQAAAIGLAAASLRYDNRPGKVSAAIGGGAWRGQGAAAFGLGYTSEDGSMRANVSGTTAGGQWGIGAGLSFTLN